MYIYKESYIDSPKMTVLVDTNYIYEENRLLNKITIQNILLTYAVDMPKATITLQDDNTLFVGLRE